MRRGAQQFLHPWALDPAGALDRLPRRDVVDRLVGRCLRSGNLPRCGAHHVKGPVGYLGEVLRYEHGIDEAQAVQVLCDLDPFWEGGPVERFVNPRTEEPDQSSRLCPGELPKRPPRGEDAAGSRVAKVHEIGKAGSAMLHEGLNNLDHLQKSDGPLLHPRAAGHGRGHQWESLGGGALDRNREPLGRGDPDRAS